MTITPDDNHPTQLSPQDDKYPAYDTSNFSSQFSLNLSEEFFEGGCNDGVMEGVSGTEGI